MKPAATIRTQMIHATGTVTSVLLLLLVPVTLYVAQRELYALGRRYALQQAEAIAARAALATNPSAARELLRDTVGHGDVLAGELLSAAGHPVAELMAPGAAPGRCRFWSGAAPAEGLARAWEAGSYWCVSAPIFARKITGLCREKACIIGRLRLFDSTLPVGKVVLRLMAIILLLGVAVLLMAMFSLYYVAERISSPLRELADVMRRFSAGDRTARATEGGPEETRAISRVYNALIAQQEEQARLLEERVAQRTQDLRAATMAAQKAERDRTIFMAQVSHEMRTPLHVIQAQAAEVLHELEFWRQGEHARANANLILQESTELAYRVDQILELVRSRTAHQSVHIQSVSFRKVKDHLLEKFTPLAARNGNTLVVRAEDACVESDRDKLLQILSNLVHNACKYTAMGRVEVLLTNLGQTFQLSVTDTGSGIPAEALADIWNEFRQARSPDGGQSDGFGLGLSIVRSHAALLGGECHLESATGRGTTVRVSLPARTSACAGEEPVRLEF